MALPLRGGRWSARHERLARDNDKHSWGEWCAEIEGRKGWKICGSIKPSDKTPCMGRASPNGRCSFHGGKSLSGHAHPNYQGKGYSVVLGSARGQKLERLLESGQLVSVREELAVANVMHADLLIELESIEAGGATFEDLRDSFAEIEQAVLKSDAHETARTLKVHSSLLGSGLQAIALREEIRKSGDHIARLAKVERQRLETIEDTMTSQQVLGILSHFTDIVRQTVDDGLTDPKVLRLVADAMRRLVTPGVQSDESVA